MKIVSLKLFLTTICLICLGCSYHSMNLHTQTISGNTVSDDIAIFEQTPNKPYEIMGKVHSHCRWNWFFGWAGCSKNAMKDLLKEEAAKLGANAIINVKQESFSQFEWTDIHYHATAIHWK